MKGKQTSPDSNDVLNASTMADPKTTIVNEFLNQPAYKDLDQQLKSDIRTIFRIAFDVRHYNPVALHVSGLSGNQIFKMKISLAHMAELALQLIDDIEQTNQSLFQTIVDELKEL